MEGYTLDVNNVYVECRGGRLMDDFNFAICNSSTLKLSTVSI